MSETKDARCDAEEVAMLEERCRALEERLGVLTELYDVTQARLEAFEEREPDARTCAEWVATVALKSSDVYSAARRYLCGEQRQRHAEEIREAIALASGEAMAELLISTSGIEVLP